MLEDATEQPLGGPVLEESSVSENNESTLEIPEPTPELPITPPTSSVDGLSKEKKEVRRHTQRPWLDLCR